MAGWPRQSPDDAGIGREMCVLYRPGSDLDSANPSYTPAMVSAQIKATTDAGLDSWIFWDAGNKYTSLRQVLVTH